MRSRLRYAILLTTMLLGLLSPQRVNGQQRLYGLRTVSAAEYIAAIAAIMSSNNSTLDNAPALIHDFMRRYVVPDTTLSFADLETVYEIVHNPAVTPSQELALWNSALVSAWLNEHSIDLDHAPHMSFTLEQFPYPSERQAYQIAALPRDFKGDSGHEWLLTISISENDNLPEFNDVNYLLATRDDAGRYHVLSFPIPWVEPGYATIWETSNTTLQPRIFQDLNSTGIPIWLVTSDPYGYYETGGIYALTWRDGQIVDLMDSNAIFQYDTVVDFEPSPLTGQRDIVLSTPKTDNWGCLHTEVQTIRWDGTRWTIVQTNTEFAVNAGCAWRDAETAMWDSRWSTAIAAYQIGFIRAATDTIKPNPELVDYMLFRLALAHMLNGQPLQASAVTTLFQLHPPGSDLMRQLHGIMPRRPVSDPYAICLAAHDVFQRYKDAKNYDDESSWYYAALPTTIVVGMTWDDVAAIDRHPMRFGPGLPDPNKAGCDLSKTVLVHLRTYSFTLLEQPAIQLQKFGFPVAQALSFDINDDGQTEWVVWLALDTPPLFFAPTPDRTSYHVSLLPIHGQLHIFDNMVRALPNHAGSVLITLTMDTAVTDPRKCPPTFAWYGELNAAHPIGSVAMWRLQAGELIAVVKAPVCTQDDYGEFEYHFSLLSHSNQAELPTTFDLYAPVTSRKPNGIADLASVTYTWDAATHRYLPPSEVDQADEPQPLSEQSHYQIEGTFDQALRRRDYAAALSVADKAIITPCSMCSMDDYVAYHFLRATALEMLNRSNEAVAEYVFVATRAPTREQRDLAARHLEARDF